MKMKTLNDKAMLVRHVISKKDFRKFDKKVTEEIAQQHGADAQNAGRYNKVLIARDALESINSIASRAYDHHITNTLPWDDWGSRILPADHYFDYTDAQRSFRTQFDQAVAEFVAEYPKYIEEAKSRLNGMFQLSDYPHPDTITEHFSIAVKVRPLPEAEDFRVDLGSKEVKKIRAEVEADMQNVVKAAIADLWERLFESLTTMHNRFRSYANEDVKRFYGSWVENVHEIVELIPKLNFTNDPELEEIRRKVEALLAQHNTETLKGDNAALTETADAASDILNQMAGYIGD